MKATDITRLCAVGLFLGLVLLACNKESDQTRCENDSECDGGYICTEGLCQLFEQNDIVCEPECSVDNCEMCDDGKCMSACLVGEVCFNGVCGNICDPCMGMCDYDACEICYDGWCDSACDPYDCKICRNSRCVSTCLATEVCMAGHCISTFCDPPCSGAVSFCNEIYKCVPTECEEMNCTQYDPNRHCAESVEGVECFCNPGWSPDYTSYSCFECQDDETSNNPQEPTQVELPLYHTGILCVMDVYSFYLEAGSTVNIRLTNYDRNYRSMSLRLKIDEDVIAIEPEVINYTSDSDQIYSLIISSRSLKEPTWYTIRINYD